MSTVTCLSESNADNSSGESFFQKTDYFRGICWVELEFKTESCQLFFIFFILAVPLTIDLKLHALSVYMYVY